MKSNARQKTYLQKETVESVFPEYYLIKPQSFDNQLRDSLDEWIYFFKNSDTPETITAKGLTKAKQVLDVMQLPKADQKKYQRYLEDMSYRKSITETIKFEVKEEAERIKNMIMEKGMEQGTRSKKKRKGNCTQPSEKSSSLGNHHEFNRIKFRGN